VTYGAKAEKRGFFLISLLSRGCADVQRKSAGLKLAKNGKTAEKRAVFSIVGSATNAVGLKCL
jgi:hypothetical protein